MKPIADSRELRAFIRRSPAPETFTHLAADLRQRFGLDLTPAQASHVWRTLRNPSRGRQETFERDQALMAFIADRADLLTVDQLLGRVAQAFGSARTPSRSQLFRLVQRVRDDARAAASLGNRSR